MRELSVPKKLKALGAMGVFRLIRDLLLTKITLPSARLLRHPFYIRNHGTVKLAKGFTTGPGFILDILSPNAKFEVGVNVKFNHRPHIGVLHEVVIGDNCLFASNVYISDHGHGTYKGENQDSPLVPPNNRPLAIAPVYIGENVWVGENVCILPGVTIGSGAIIGANSVVTTNIPQNSIAAGSPARVIKVWEGAQKCWVKKP